MLHQGEVWFLVADGRRARIFAESRRGAELSARDQLEIGGDELYDIQDRPPRTFSSVGAARHAVDQGRDLHEEEEFKFLRRVAKRLTDAEKDGAFEHLVIAAPPRALGALRNELPQAVRAKVRAEEPKDLLDEPEPRLRERLRDALRG